MIYPPRLARPCFRPSYHCSQSLSAYPAKLVDCPHSRADFAALPVGYLIAPFLEGPVLVYHDDDLDRALALEELLTPVRARVLAAYRAIASAKRENRTPAEARAQVAESVSRLKRLHGELVRLAKGYAFPGLHFCGLEFVCMFDSEETALALMLGGDRPPPVQVLYSLAALPPPNVVIPEELVDYG